MSADKTTILIVEDEPAIAALISFAVKEANWHSIAVESAEEAWDVLHRHTPNLVLLDWMLPGQSGISFLARLRADRQLQGLPVIMLTAKGMEEDKVTGLERGADDYITKPFSPRELTARIKALIRRKSPEHGEKTLYAGPIMLDPVACEVHVDGKKIEIGNSEYKLLKYLMAHPQRVFSRSQLLDKVWGNHVMIEERTVDVHVLRLRKALTGAEQMIETVRGIGYKLSER
jgi:two-component system phosphate regulon response regulator PhoB